MDRHIIISVLAAAIFLAAACNREDPGSGKNRTDICSIMTIGQTESLDSLEYDAQGRLVKVMTYLVEDEELADLIKVVTYSYSDGRIDREVGVDDMIDAHIVYTLGKDNLISGASIGILKVDYAYDADGHMTKAGDLTFTWKDGDLVSTSDGYTYTYSELANPGYWPETLALTDEWLFRKGYFGKLPKHLPAAWSMTEAVSGVSHQFSCEYELEGGVLSECSMTAIHTTGSTPSISEYRITINWKKY